MAHLLISAAHKSSGKTTVTLGLAASLAQRGLTVQTFKKGPDYIDPLWLARASGRECYNLDFHTMTPAQIRQCFAGNSADADIALIEGNKGLYDGLDLDGSNSNAALATLLNAPVILVIDVRGMTRGIAPLILGYQQFEAGLNIAGVIFNNVGGSRHESKLRAIVEHYTELPVIGAVPRTPGLMVSERHLGLIPANETADADARIRETAAVIAGHVELDRLVGIARQASPVSAPALPRASDRVADVRIGIARDAAFGFYYADDLAELHTHGAELVFFDTLRDASLPPVDALFIGGGFPETQMRQLSANRPMRDAVRKFVEDGRPVYAECGGLMYLGRSITWHGESSDMVGALPLDVVMHDRPVGRGYVRLAETGSHPWGSLSDGSAGEIAAHEFHYSSIENVGPGITFAFAVKRGYGIDGQHDGLIYRNVVANYSHLRSVPPVSWARRFVEHVRRVSKRETGGK